MKRVFTATTMSADQEIVKGLLDEAGIPSMIRNEHLAMALGELADGSPEIWILNDEDYPRAKEIVDDLRKSNVETAQPWICSDCGEEIEGQFTSCWNCGKDRPLVLGS
jgi:Putative prokaryotic signal transducing protein